MPGRLEHHAKNPFSMQSTVEASEKLSISLRTAAQRGGTDPVRNLDIAVGDICNATLSERFKKKIIYILFFIDS